VVAHDTPKGNNTKNHENETTRKRPNRDCHDGVSLTEVVNAPQPIDELSDNSLLLRSGAMTEAAAMTMAAATAALSRCDHFRV